MDWLKKIVASIGAVVDVAVPVGVGNRTKLAVVACPALSLAAPLLAVVPGAQPFLPLIPVLQHVLCGAAPILALAGLVRK